MRRYIRHPSTMPLDYQIVEGDGGMERLRNVSAGGICFATHDALPMGKAVDITIHLGEQDFQATGEVVWCRGVNGHHEIGLRFRDAATVFAVRMVEQLCYIEQYREHVLQTEGRDLSSEQAATEWVERYADEFPRLDS